MQPPSAPSPSDDDDRLDAWAYDLPRSSIAQRPSARRSEARLCVVYADRHQHARIGDLPALLDPGDLLVVNDTRVVPGRLFARRATGGRVEIALAGPYEDGFAALVRPSAKLRPGERVQLVGPQGGGPEVTLGELLSGGMRAVRGPLDEATLQTWGQLPLPPYIERPEGPDGGDAERYQTVFASSPGALAAPTAGLHFDAVLLRALAARGVQTATVTLHVGAGTWAPVRAERLSAHPMHPERYRVPEETRAAIEGAEARGQRVIPVGTTTCRALEAWHRAGRHDGAWRTTDLLLRPGDGPTVARCLMTNFHLPGSTLLPLVASLPGIGRRRLLALYDDAIRAGYRFYSYGDAMLLL